jgi:heme oxygenase
VTLLDELRKATRPAHDRLHELSDTSTRQGYGRFLQAMHRGLAAMPRDVVPAATLRALRADLAELELPTPTDQFQSLPAGLGCQYVVSGSQVGAGMMLPHAREHDWPRRYLSDRHVRRWADVKRALADQPADDKVVQQAVDAFDVFVRSFERSASDPLS